MQYIYTHTSGEGGGGSFNAHCSTLTAPTWQIWWKFVNILKVLAKDIWLTFCGHGVLPWNWFTVTTEWCGAI